MLSVGEILKIKGKKRIVAVIIKIEQTEEEYTFSVRGAYRPSPKSQLRNKIRFFRKKKMNLILQ